MHVVVLHGEERRYELASTYELTVEHAQFSMKHIQRQCLVREIVHHAVYLEDGIGDRSLDLVRYETDEFLLLVDEVVVLHGFLVHFLVEIEREILDLLVRSDIFEVQREPEGEFGQQIDFVDRIKISERLRADHECAGIDDALLIIEERNDKESVFWDFFQEFLLVEFVLFFLYEYHVVNEDAFRGVVLEKSLQFGSFSYFRIYFHFAVFRFEETLHSF